MGFPLYKLGESALSVTDYGLITLVTSADSNPSLEDPLPNTVTLEVRALTYKWGGGYRVQSATVGKPATGWSLSSCDVYSLEHNTERKRAVQEGTVVLGPTNHRGVQRLRDQGTGPREPEDR